jgi:SNF2 family DNA or RNA helicase
VKTHGKLVYRANPAAEHGFRAGRGDAVWALKATPPLMIKVKRLFPRANPYRDGYVVLHDTPEVCRDLEWLLERWPMEMDDAAAAALHRGSEEHQKTEATINEILSGERPHLEWAFQELAREPRDYQLLAADLALTTGALLLCDDVGLGKTFSSLLVLREAKALPALVVCPTHLPRQWQRELQASLPWLRSHVVRQGTPYDPAQRREMKGHDPDVLIMGYSKLRGWRDALAGKMRTVIFDEAQELRRSGTQKYDAAGQIADQAAYRLGLTATPVYNYGDEIHTILEVIAPGRLGTREEFLREWGGKTISTFSGSDHATVRDPAALGIHLRAEGLMLRRTAKEVGRELPEVIRIPHSIDTDESLLEELIEDAVDLAEIIVSASARRSELWRAHGEFDWRMRQATGIAKAPYVAEFVKLLVETEEQVVLFGWHRAVYDIWLERLKAFEPTLYTGTESPTQKERSFSRFVLGDSRVLIVSLRSGAGLDGLQGVARVCAFGELDWSPAIHTQCVGRLARDGQEDPVRAFFLVSDHGSDPKMAEVLNLKRQQAEPIVEPDAPLFEPIPDTRSRVRDLARDVLEQRRRRASQPPL